MAKNAPKTVAAVKNPRVKTPWGWHLRCKGNFQLPRQEDDCSGHSPSQERQPPVPRESRAGRGGPILHDYGYEQWCDSRQYHKRYGVERDYSTYKSRSGEATMAVKRGNQEKAVNNKLDLLNWDLAPRLLPSEKG